MILLRVMLSNFILPNEVHKPVIFHTLVIKITSSSTSCIYCFGICKALAAFYLFLF
uniref:Uncharacterized protein n=2 Tax=Arundo donax TaxID=35708 RepID=A0A0A9GJP4_ARUDO